MPVNVLEIEVRYLEEEPTCPENFYDGMRVVLEGSIYSIFVKNVIKKKYPHDSEYYYEVWFHGGGKIWIEHLPKKLLEHKVMGDI